MLLRQRDITARRHKGGNPLSGSEPSPEWGGGVGAQAAEPEAEAQPMLRFRLPAAPGAAAPRIGERVRAASTASPGIHIEIPVTK